MQKVLLIFVGAGAGGVMRYGLSGWIQRLTQTTFPAGTLVVNVVGCLAIGFLGAVLAGPVLVREDLRVALLVGVLGGFTTFSTYAMETVALAADRELLRAGVNLLASNALGFVAVWLGLRVAQRIYGV
jgi:CrcB protein